MAATTILAVAMLRNECDIVEAFVRHHAGLVDRIHVLLHASADSTAAILERLAAEGLPITVEHDSEPALAKEVQFNALIARALAAFPADIVLPLDADEFVMPPDRAVLEAEIAALPPGAALWLEWQTYLPSPSDDPSVANPVARLRRRRRREPMPVVKACFPASSYRAPGATLVDGQHELVRRDPPPVVHVPARGLRLAHFPVRSPEQFAAKIVVGWLSRQLSPDRIEAHSREWRRWYEKLRPRFVLAPADLPAAAQDYYGAAPGDLVDDPLPAPPVLRYGALIDPAPLGRIAALAEAFAQRLGRVDAVLAGGGDRAALEAMLAERAELRAALRECRQRWSDAERLRQRLAVNRRRVVVLGVALGLAVAALAAALLAR